ncbi:MAG: hypothetical protein ACLRP3_02695 [Escherichia sp.]
MRAAKSDLAGCLYDACATWSRNGLSAWRNSTFLIGARSVLLDIFTPDACLALLEQQRCTCMLGATPFVYDL